MGIEPIPNTKSDMYLDIRWNSQNRNWKGSGWTRSSCASY